MNENSNIELLNDDENYQKLIRQKNLEIDKINSDYEKFTRELLFQQEILIREENKFKEIKDELMIKYEENEMLEQEFGTSGINAEVNHIKKNAKSKKIQKKIENEIRKKIPQIEELFNPNLKKQEENDLFQLAYKNVIIINKDFTIKFLITKKTNFSELKHQLIQINLIDDESNYVFADERQAIIMDEKAEVDEFIRSYSTFSNTFYLFSTNEVIHRKKLTDIQESSLSENFKSSSHIKDSKIEEVNIKFDYTDYIVKKLNGIFPMLGIYQRDIKNQNRSERSTYEQATNLDTSFLMFLILLILYIFTLITIYYLKNINISKFNKEYLQQLFDNSEVKDPKSFYKYLGYNIGFLLLNNSNDNYNKLPIYYNYTEVETVSQIFNLGSEFQFNDQNKVKLFDDLNKKVNELSRKYKKERMKNGYLASSIKLIVKKVKNMDCNENFILNSESQCYYPYYDYNTAKIENYLNIPADLEAFSTNLTVYKHSYTNKLHELIITLLGYTDTSGYQTEIIKDTSLLFFLFDLSKMIPAHENFQNQVKIGKAEINNKFDETYFLYEQNNRGISLLFTLYNPDIDLYYSVIIPFSFLPTGIIIPEKVIIKEFYFNYFYMVNIAFEVIRIILIILLITIQVFKSKENYENKRRIFNKKMIINSLLSINYIVIIMIKFIELTGSINNASFNGSKIVDTSAYSYNGNNVELLECIFLLILTIRLINFLELNDGIKLYFKSVVEYLQIIFYYSLCFLPIILIFSFLSYIIFGKNDEASSKFNSAYYQTLLLPIGTINIANWLKVSEFWAVLYIISYYSFLLFMVLIVFIGIFADSLRGYVKNRGYPEDNDNETWNTSDYFSWIFFYKIKE